MYVRRFSSASAAIWLSILLTVYPSMPFAAEPTCKDVAEKYGALKQTDQIFFDSGLAVSSGVHSYGALCGPVCIEKLLPEFVAPAEALARNPQEDVIQMVTRIAKPLVARVPGFSIERRGLVCETLKDVAHEFFQELGVKTEVSVRGVDEATVWGAAPRAQISSADITEASPGVGKILFVQTWTKTITATRIEYNLYLGHFFKLEKVLRIFANGTIEVTVDDPIFGPYNVRLSVEPANDRIYRVYFSPQAPKFWQDATRYGAVYLSNVITIKRI